MTRPRNRFLRFLLDTLLIPIAVLIVLIEDVLWAGALALLRRISNLAAVQALRARVARLPASIALPLFLVPEGLSHLAGAYATMLLAQGHVMRAIIFGVLVKGTSTLVLVWIYHTCEETLLRVAWFVRLHHWALAVRDWAVAEVAPMRARVREALASVRGFFRNWLAMVRVRAAGPRLNARRRLRAWRARFSSWVATMGRR